MMTTQHVFVKRILGQLSPEERHLFTHQQIDALHKAALALPKTNHPINIRWSVPFPGQGIYMVFFAGKERRSRQRLISDADYKLLPRAIVLLFMLLGCGAITGLMYGQRLFAMSQQHAASDLNQDSGIHPVVVPFKHDRGECETSGREWQDGQCIDHEHDHRF